LRRSPFLLLAAYLICRAALGAALNPLENGPDEAAHLEYVRAVADSPLARATGVEARQLPTYYWLAAIVWRATDGWTEAARVFAVRIVSGVCGAVTLAATWSAARAMWPGRRAPAAIAASLALAPGHLFLLASVNNDPLATAAGSLSFLAAVRLALGGARASVARGWALWLLASVAALLVKPTTLPVVAGCAAALAVRHRTTLWSRPTLRLGMASAAVALAAGNVYFALQAPTSGALPALARFWPLAVLRAPVAYVGGGGLGETFRTWWYGYDYLVRWPSAAEALLAGSVAGVSVAALSGLALGAVRRSFGGPGGVALPGVVWWCAGAQIAFVLVRFGLGDVLRIEMGGAAQAKAFFAALAPLGLLWSAGLVAAGAALRVPERDVARGALAWLLALDAVSLAVTTWQQYRWWQVGA
jgi:hypothetical protein